MHASQRFAAEPEHDISRRIWNKSTGILPIHFPHFHPLPPRLLLILFFSLDVPCFSHFAFSGKKSSHESAPLSPIVFPLFWRLPLCSSCALYILPNSFFYSTAQWLVLEFPRPCCTHVWSLGLSQTCARTSTIHARYLGNFLLLKIAGLRS